MNSLLFNQILVFYTAVSSLSARREGDEGESIEQNFSVTKKLIIE